MKHGEYQRDENKYDKENFCYDEQRDVYICPDRKELPFCKERETNEGVVPKRQWIYKGNECTNCSALPQRTKAKYRTVAREKREILQEEMRRRLLSEEGREKYKKRLYWVGPVFGHLKHNLGFRNFLLRILETVHREL